MTFLHPWIIGLGVVAAMAPVVVHWLTRPRPVRAPLSTIRFVREAIRERRARHHLRDFLVLALRTVAVLLLATAIARPQFGPQPLISERQTGDTVRVVILDASQSMAATEHGIQAIERARTVAAEHLRYRPGLWANLVVAGASPRAVFDQASTNFDALREELARCQPLPQRLDVSRAIDLTARLLGPTSPEDVRRRELVVVSDFQRSNWARADFSPLPEATQIQLESVAPATTPENLAILDVRCEVSSVQGQNGRLLVEVGNFGPSPRKVTAEVTLGESAHRLTGTCPAGRTTTLTEEIELREIGWQSGEAKLVGVEDALAADDVRPLTVRLRSRPVYALVTRQTVAERPSSSHYLECALSPGFRPGAKDEENAKGAARVVRIDPTGLSAQQLASAELIALDHPGKLTEESIKLLVGLMRRGRPILYVASELADAMNLKRIAETAGAGLQMPIEFVPPPQGQSRRDLFLSMVRGDRRPFQVFGDRLEAIKSSLRFTSGLSSRRLSTGLEEDLLAAYNDGAACMVLTSSDAGSLAVINADLAASNLAKTAAFVPLAEELVERLLDRGKSDASATCGEPMVVNLPADTGPVADLRIVGPEASAENAANPWGNLVEEAGGVAWRWSSPSRPGVYQVQRAGKPVFSLAVRIPAEESRLESISPEVLQGRLAAGHNVYYRSAATAGEPRDDVWTWFLAACVLCLLGELAVLMSFRT